MKIINDFLLEGVTFKSKFVVHKHDARNTNIHFDLRFIDNIDNKKLNSFAFGKDFETAYTTKIVGVRTKDHNLRWLDLESHRLDNFDKGDLTILSSSRTFFHLDFKGKKLKGKYKLFLVKSKRKDNWLLIKDK